MIAATATITIIKAITAATTITMVTAMTAAAATTTAIKIITNDSSNK